MQPKVRVRASKSNMQSIVKYHGSTDKSVNV